MLGRGLQSLIPPSDEPQGQNAPPVPAGQAPVPAVPVAQHSAPAPQGAPAPSAPEPTPHLQPPASVPDISVPPAVPDVESLGGNRDFQRELSPSPAREELAAPIESEEKSLPPPAAFSPAVPAHAEPSAPAAPESRGQKETAPQNPPRFDEPKISEHVFHIEVAKIKPNPDQPRRTFGEESIRELASSIREFGILQPIVVTKVLKEVPGGTDVEYVLVAGERRWLASKLLGLETIPAIVRNIDLERERLEMAVIENIQRENLTPIEVARAIARLQDEFRLTQREIAVRLGKSRETVANTVRLLDLPQAAQDALERGEITESHGRLLLAVADPAAQQRLFKDLLETRMTTRELKNRVEALKRGDKKEEAPMPLSPELKMFEEKLSADLGAPVRILQSGQSGRITITFYSGEELQNIVEKLGNSEN